MGDPGSRLADGLAAFDEAQEIQAKNPSRARQLFRLSAQRFESVVSTGVVNGRLEFDLGNAYLQAGDVGKAILHYRRAQRLIPADPLLKDNLGVARSRCLTFTTPTRRSSLLRGVFFLHYATPRADRARTALIMYLLFWALLTLRNSGWRLLAESGLTRRASTVSVLLCGLMALSLFVSVGVDALSDRHHPPGVVTAMDVTVQKGPGSGYQRQFVQPLQAGVEFTMLQRRGDWWQVELADGQSGWIEAKHAELIVR